MPTQGIEHGSHLWDPRLLRVTIEFAEKTKRNENADLHLCSVTVNQQVEFNRFNVQNPLNS